MAVTGPSASSFLTVYPTGETRPLAANLNFNAGDTVGNRAFVKLGTGGKVTIYNNTGSVDVIVDVNGWFTDSSVAGTAGVFTPLTPARISDNPIGAGATVAVQVTGQGGVPATGVARSCSTPPPSAPPPGWLTAFPTGVDQAGDVGPELRRRQDEVEPRRRGGGHRRQGRRVLVGRRPNPHRRRRLGLLVSSAARRFGRWWLTPTRR